MHPKNALVAAPISLARSMREQREIAWAMSTIRCKSFCQSVKGGMQGYALRRAIFDTHVAYSFWESTTRSSLLHLPLASERAKAH